MEGADEVGTSILKFQILTEEVVLELDLTVSGVSEENKLFCYSSEERFANCEIICKKGNCFRSSSTSSRCKQLNQNKS
jgi:hypothetical protein